MESTCITSVLQQLQQQQRPASLEYYDDNISNNSRSSLNFQSSLASTRNSDSETGHPLSVRDMIKRYNSVSAGGCSRTLAPTRRASQNSLPLSNSVYCGVNKGGSQSNGKQLVTHLSNRADEYAKSSQECGNCRKKSDYCYSDCCCDRAVKSMNHRNEGNSNRDFRRDHRTISNHELKGVASLKTITSKEKVFSEINESLDEGKLKPTESSYQSKTTIAKTASGVRIIIDIFFDQEQTVSPNIVVGSRVETDIPQSRILSEFQQQSLTTSASQMMSK